MTETKAITLREQTEELIALSDRLSDPSDSEALVLFQNALTNHADKIDRCVNYIQATETTIDWLKMEKRHLDAQIAKLENGIERMKERASEVMTLVGSKELVGAKGHKFREQIFESIEIDDIELVPEEYKSTVITEKADKASIKLAIKGGIEVPGASLKTKPSIIVK